MLFNKLIVGYLNNELIFYIRQDVRPNIPGWEQFQYEYNSLMHYDAKGFAIRVGLPTMSSRNGQRFGGNDVGPTEVCEIYIPEMF